MIHTPGHTPESICLLVTDLRRGADPWFLLTGDTLFVGSVGRPDLPGHERDNAQALHGSLQRLLALPGDIEIYPAHFAGSACGVGMSGKPASTLTFEKRRWNEALTLPVATFVDKVAGTVPPKPVEMDAILRANRGLP